MGDFTARILDVVGPRELHLVDPWVFASGPGYADAWYGGALARSQYDMDRIYDDVRRRLHRPISDNRVVIHRITSTEAAEQFADECFDWVYIDGNHLYEYVSADLEGFARKVRPGGFLSGDDYGRVGWWEDGVTRAVNDFIRSNEDFEVIVLEDQFLLKRL
jgi:hypothetical protein